jgi:hypothetical protein
MKDDLIAFYPAEPLTYKKVRQDVFEFQLITLIGTALCIYYGRFFPLLALMLACIGVLIIFLSLFRRYPTKILINTRTHVLKAFYLTVNGKEKAVLIDLDKAVLNTQRRMSTSSKDDFTITVYDNIFSRWIKIDRTHNFTPEQLTAIHTTLKTLMRER